MPAPVALPKALAGGRLFTTAEAKALGMTRDQLSGKAVRRLVRGVYVDARTPRTEDQIRDAVELRCPEAVWIGLVAVELWGLPTPLATPPPRVGVPQPPPNPEANLPHVLLAVDNHRRTPRQGFLISVGRYEQADVAVVAGRRLLRPAALLLWLARDRALEDLVAIGDAALRRNVMTVSDLDMVLERNPQHPGAGRCRAARDLLDRRSKSPMESRLRVAFVLAGLPRPEVNRMVTWAPPGYVGGEVDTLGELDLAWPEAKVGVEYDGIDHAHPRARSNDHAKRKLFKRYGWEIVPVTAWDYFNRLDSVIEEVRQLLADRGAI